MMSHTASSPAGAVGSDDVGSDEVQEFVAEHPNLVRFSRVGWVAKGIVYSLVGVLALTVAVGGRNDTTPEGEASQTGAIAKIAEASYGTTVLIIIAVGLVLYALWRIVTIALPAKNDAHTWMTRLGYAVSAIVYLLLAWTAISFVRHSQSTQSGGGSEEAKVDGVTRELMSHTGGQWLLALVGLVIVGIGVYFFIRGVRRPFDDQLDGRGVGPLDYRHLVMLGRVGWIGRAAMMALIGFFLVRAAWQSDADQASGLDGALRQSSSTTFGMAVVFVVAIGLIVYGVYCVVSAPRRRLAPADT
jgi:hypothetical protein